MTMTLLMAVMISCSNQSGFHAGLDPAGEARSGTCVSDKQVALLSGTIGVDELKALWGKAEGQPGPRFTYRCRDHDDRFFWVYYKRENEASADSRWIVERIVRADRIEEAGVVVWPPGYAAPQDSKIERSD